MSCLPRVRLNTAQTPAFGLKRGEREIRPRLVGYTEVAQKRSSGRTMDDLLEVSGPLVAGP
jgi:hypothetical protein